MTQHTASFTSHQFRLCIFYLTYLSIKFLFKSRTPLAKTSQRCRILIWFSISRNRKHRYVSYLISIFLFFMSETFFLLQVFFLNGEFSNCQTSQTSRKKCECIKFGKKQMPNQELNKTIDYRYDFIDFHIIVQRRNQDGMIKRDKNF